jgi:hypothetical protein
MMRTAFLLLTLAPLTVCAQETAFDYDNQVSGSTTTLESGSSVTQPLTSNAFTGQLTGSLILTGTAGAPGSTLAFSFNVSGMPNQPEPFSGLLTPFEGSGNLYCDPTMGCVTLNVVDGTVTSATVDLNDDPYHNSWFNLSITPAGASYSSELSLPEQGDGGCQSATPVTYSASGGTYVGPTINNCSVVASGVGPGVWVDPPVSTPEINASGAPAALTLLIGSLCVLLARRTNACRTDSLAQ